MFGKKKSDREASKKVSKSAIAKAKKLLRYVWPFKVYLFVGLVFLLLSSLTTLAFPILLGKLFDVSGSQNINTLALVLLGVFFVNAIFSFFRIVLFEHAAQRTLAYIRQDAYSHLISLPMTFFSTRRVGELGSRISADVSLLQSTFTTTIAEFLRQILTILGGIVLLLSISPKLTGFMLAVVPLVIVVVVIFGKFIRKMSKLTQDKVADSNTIVEETLQGVFNVKAYANERFEISRYTAATNDIINLAIKTATYRGAFVSFIIFGLFGSIIGVIWYGLILRDAELLKTGDLFSFLLLTVFIGASIGGIADLYSQLVQAIGASENLMEIFDEEPETIQSDKGDKAALVGKIEFRNVDFNYSTRADIPVLQKVSFSVESGKEVALVGPSGSGKSTIVSLLLRFYDPSSGHVRIDDKDSSDFNLHSLRKQMAIVPQEVILFGGSIRENIGYGNPDAGIDEIKEAAVKANAAEFIEKLPEKYDTIVGERGIQLSGGQRQRVAIARAVLKDPRILILDEATSSLDSESEQLVQDALDKLMKGRTSIVIAHRLSTIQKADNILVVKDGQIVEQGTHNELLDQKNGEYFKLHTIQSRKEKLDVVV
ncbi:MAG: multidrug ABC transporter ATP-binding protein [Crocinitomicaceae bacterium]|nr:multidrug ABC transporter ATP-binding protein [Crocinitomicaceae bacterium]